MSCAVVNIENRLAVMEAKERIEARILSRDSRPTVSSNRESNSSRWQSHFMLLW